MKRKLISFGWVSICLFAILFVCYAPSLQGPFFWDDESLVMNNQLIRSFSSIPRVFSPVSWPTDVPHSFYRPLQMITYMIDYVFWKDHAIGYHISNVIFHGLNGILLFLCLLKLFHQWQAAFLGALLFVVHPVHTEAVAYISGRADILMLTGLLIFYMSWMRVGKAPYSLMQVCGVFLGFIIALFSKESALMIPFFCGVLFLCERKVSRAQIMIGSVLVVLSALYVWMRMASRDGAGIDIYAYAWYERGISAIVSWARYATLIVWPVQLHMEHVPVVPSLLSRTFLISCGISILSGGIAWLSMKRCCQSVVGIVWYGVFLFPVLNIIPLNATFSEHWVSVPSVGIIILLTGLYASVKNARYKRIIFVNGMIVVCVLGVLTYERACVWSDPVKLYEDTLRYNDRNMKVWYNLGNELLKRNDIVRARYAYERAIAIPQKYPLMTQGRGAVELLKGLLTKTYANVGTTYAREGCYDEALRWYNKALEISPDHTTSLVNKKRALEMKKYKSL